MKFDSQAEISMPKTVVLANRQTSQPARTIPIRVLSSLNSTDSPLASSHIIRIHQTFFEESTLDDLTDNQIFISTLKYLNKKDQQDSLDESTMKILSDDPITHKKSH